MKVNESKLIFDKPTSLPLPILKATQFVVDGKKSPKHFFFESPRFNTTLRVCSGHHKPIAKAFNLDLILGAKYEK